MMSPLEKARYGRRATVGLLALLMGFIALETLLQPLPAGAMAFLMAILVLPLAAFLRPLWQGRAQAALWLTLLLMPYFCWAALGATVLHGIPGLLALLRALIIAACFTAALLMVRWQKAAAVE